ncbi:MAG TPA: CBASS cGAMP synthase [Marinilabiliaceae bacterium]|nr:CBASS cGAMP synthase [Marinilabiliaceae bacterium]
MRNLSPLFSGNKNKFLGNLNLTESQKYSIKEAKIKIREHLRSGITQIIKKEQGIDLSPRFLSQGSAVYKTRNQPCTIPPQQIDHDLGCYLPLSFHEETRHPSIAAEVFFNVVDSLLEGIIETEKWQGFESKDTCSRVIVNKQIHIDVPLYSIPDNEFGLIKESAAQRNFSMDSMSMESLSEDEWEIIKNRVLLAHREMDWIPSDPRKLNQYFKYIFENKGEQLRRICRYLKAWRDYKWQCGGGPSSIYLMILADSIFQCSIERRDDLALLNVLDNIPNRIAVPIKNPTDYSETIRIKEEDKDNLNIYATEFTRDLKKAIEDPDISSRMACNLVRNHVGDRFPLDDTLQFVPRETVLSKPAEFDKNNREPENRGRAG